MTKAKQAPGIPPTLTPAQRRVLGNCARAVGGTIYRTTQNRASVAVLERLGMVKVASHEPATLAHAHRPRVWTVTITEAGKDAIR